ncbi:hypothetical protein TUM19381_21090 [Staphylococcus aureus]|uniref:hypothetical protein n=1 Tax=Staphylococcus aureus TaxID=1280 RepID=UPI000A963C88|nr:hypothetical protein TPS5614TP_20910 [Staphylococcus aureus]BDB38659.1 hypothetical protein TPS6281TP_20360 [Staphylococcus aureus]BEU07763.1 hypothetical protein TUM19381_21090 [Staphylococcus aureus]BEU10454.1 hypothetical protein TUM19957_21200 [Staphylococcus aureus]BEU13074.1 hypothetical protein TUM19959_20500 [Staphylococcus aureus]
MKVKHGLTCAYSTFRAILKHDEFNRYFMKSYQQMSPKVSTRFETKPSHQVQFDWKETINFKKKDNQMISLNIGVLLLSYSRFIIMHDNA